MSVKPVESPSPVAIARALSGLTGALAADINYERGCLEDVHRNLSEEPPNIEKARAILAEGDGTRISATLARRQAAGDLAGSRLSQLLSDA
jgi:hypothetical protein